MRTILIFRIGIIFSLFILPEITYSQNGIWLPKKWKQNRELRKEFKVGLDNLSSKVLTGRLDENDFESYFQNYLGLIDRGNFGTKRTFRKLNKSYIILSEEFDILKNKVDLSYWNAKQSLSKIIENYSIESLIEDRLDSIRLDILSNVGMLKLESVEGQKLLTKSSSNISMLINFTVLNDVLSEFSELKGFISFKLAELNIYQAKVDEVLDSQIRSVELKIKSWLITDELIKEYRSLINGIREELDIYSIR